jgi:hypothetical protein
LSQAFNVAAKKEESKEDDIKSNYSFEEEN